VLDNPFVKLGSIIRVTREQTGMKQKELANKLGITPRHLMNIENGHRRPSCVLLFQIIQTLSISIDVVFHPQLIHNRQDLMQIIAMLYKCNKKELNVASATITALLEGKD